jgi:hypothetical protein
VLDWTDSPAVVVANLRSATRSEQCPPYELLGVQVAKAQVGQITNEYVPLLDPPDGAGKLIIPRTGRD